MISKGISSLQGVCYVFAGVTMKKLLALSLMAAFIALSVGCSSREGAQAEPPKSRKPMSQAQERAIGHGDPVGVGRDYKPRGY